ncbi:unnamed protein product [Phytomonas sp. EM1]|nr:unnamed protein product [Phytomonas sp. EM1]|eukprot:CCW62939.1 unnamed protein product [Phytomonas sp. isolate EM1]
MLRISYSALSTASVGAAALRLKDINDVFRTAQKVWNVDFQGGSATTKTLDFRYNRSPAVPLFHIMDLDGGILLNEESTSVNGDHDPLFHFKPKDEESLISRPLAERMLRTMIVQNTVDKILLEAQRQGRISFYMTMFGEEAAVTGAAAALQDQDQLYLQYREASALTYRGFTIKDAIAKCMGNTDCKHKGRMMPMIYGSDNINAQMISAPLATQIPQGSGAGYALRLENEELLKGLPPGTDLSQVPGARICATFMGEGATSEGDFHAALNFASTVGSHTLFFVRNNGYAISTTTSEQYHGDGILSRVAGYGMPGARVDGNDILAVYHTVRQARKIILRHNLPVLVEAFTYRMGHHSTSDDSTAYRKKEEIEFFTRNLEPIKRFEQFMIRRGWWDADQSASVVNETRKEVMSELRRQEKLPHWPVETLVDDVFDKPTPHLDQQKKQLIEHYERYKTQYDKERD